MAHQFARIAFTPSVRKAQKELGSRAKYARFDQGEDLNHVLSDEEASFIRARDSFYMASVNEDGWPYVQHRGGPVGFIKVLDERTVGFADFRGNRQYVSVGNFRHDNRVSLILMDYPNRRRLKLFGRVTEVSSADLETLARLEVPSYRAHVERGMVITIEAYDWNCPQHITPRFSIQELPTLAAPGAGSE
jgi:uncharacterized protein